MVGEWTTRSCGPLPERPREEQGEVARGVRRGSWGPGAQL